MKKKRKSVKTLAAPIIAMGSVSAILWGVCCLVIMYAVPIIRERVLYYGGATGTLLNCFIIGFAAGVPIIVFVISLRRGAWVHVTIDEKGMRRALFGAFCKLNISWDELKEMKCFNRGITGQIFCGKDASLKDMEFKRALKCHGLIQIPATPKILAIVRLNTDTEIVGIREETLQLMIKRDE